MIGVVGGGPAGLYLAWRLAEEGVPVTVFEKKNEIGTPVRCGEALGKDSLEALEIPVGPWAVQEIRGARLFAPSGDYVEILYDHVQGYLLERKAFEKYLAKRAARAGALILAGHEVVDLSKGEIVASHLGEERTYRVDMIVGADGIEAWSARMYGLNLPLPVHEMDKAFEYEMTPLDLDPHVLDFYFDTELAPRGYVWVFPKDKDTANVGVGVAGDAPKTAREYLDMFLERYSEKYGFESASIVEVKGGGVPVGGLLRQLSWDGFLLVGDAARQVHPLHGGGMALAMEAAKIASEVIVKAWRKRDFSREVLMEYDRVWWEKRGKELESLVKKRKAFEKLTNEDFNLLVRAFTGEEIMEIAHRPLSPSLLKKLARYPRLLTIFSKVLS